MPETRSLRDRLRRRWRSRRFVVRDGSMLPGLRPGDRVWVDPGSPRNGLPALGEIVVLQDPELPARRLIKRVVGRDEREGTVTVLGDATGASRDSRDFGPVPRDAIVGVAWFRYLPTARRGPIEPPRRPAQTLTDGGIPNIDASADP